MGELYVTTVDNPKRTNDYTSHEYKWIVHNGWSWYLADFPTEIALRKWLRYCGLKMTFVEEKEWFDKEMGMWRRYKIDIPTDCKCNGGFCNRDEVPENAKPIRLLSNGSLVTGYILNDGECLHIYRPNPNLKNVYHPLTLKKHIKYRRRKGGM